MANRKYTHVCRICHKDKEGYNWHQVSKDKWVCSSCLPTYVKLLETTIATMKKRMPESE